MRNRLQHVSCGPKARSCTVKWVVTKLSQSETAVAAERLPASPNQSPPLQSELPRIETEWPPASKSRHRRQPLPTKSPLISHDKLRLLYATMLKCRTLEERARILFKQSKFTGNYYAAIGQEAAAVGTAIDLRPDDTIGPSHRDFITAFIKGAPLDKMFCHLFARRQQPRQRPLLAGTLRLRSAERDHAVVDDRRAVEYRHRRRPRQAR